ncbi:MAG: kelch repeat-containing protein [Nitrospirales bacterium]
MRLANLSKLGFVGIHSPASSIPSLLRLASRRYFCVTALLIGLTLIVPFSVSAEDTLSTRGVWKSMVSARTARTEVAAAAIGGKIYVIGGLGEPSLGNVKDLAITPLVEEYDSATEQWTTRAPLPVGLHHVGIGVIGNRVYVIGGFKQSLMSVWKPVATVYVYDAARDAWSEASPMPTARGALAVAEVGGNLYAIGGYDGDGNTPAVESYDPVQNVWTVRAPLPIPRDHLAAATVKKTMYAIGGRLNWDYQNNLSVTEAYDPSTDSWTRVADLPTVRSGITAGVIDNMIYVLGGESPGGTFSTNEAYVPAQDRWYTMTPMPTARHGLGSAVVDQRLYVISGGPKPGGSFSGVNEMFVPPLARTPQRMSGRASSKQVGTIMALLATFQDAQALPPESSPDANRLIKALIQFQAAFMKSAAPAITQLLSDALTVRFEHQANAEVARFHAAGWTSESLEALVEFITDRKSWQQPDIRAGFQTYNVGDEDFALLANTLITARRNLAEQGQNLHAVYASRRREMPGARS